jgi:hypothetical protein
VASRAGVSGATLSAADLLVAGDLGSLLEQLDRLALDRVSLPEALDELILGGGGHGGSFLAMPESGAIRSRGILRALSSGTVTQVTGPGRRRGRAGNSAP